ncbi:hypothetical protein RRG08_065142 [Elysia crispata]|uniref:Uncharacterized protein n=1 Tax=Elysia crispata TaxID=231223 RepID=A0AAE0ZB20_9GAST|nr:hypothetical protein RRG08_065142 [Elysia crispata]
MRRKGCVERRWGRQTSSKTDQETEEGRGVWRDVGADRQAAEQINRQMRRKGCVERRWGRQTSSRTDQQTDEKEGVCGETLGQTDKQQNRSTDRGEGRGVWRDVGADRQAAEQINRQRRRKGCVERRWGRQTSSRTDQETDEKEGGPFRVKVIPCLQEKAEAVPSVFTKLYVDCPVSRNTTLIVAQFAHSAQLCMSPSSRGLGPPLFYTWTLWSPSQAAAVRPGYGLTQCHTGPSLGEVLGYRSSDTLREKGSTLFYLFIVLNYAVLWKGGRVCVSEGDEGLTQCDMVRAVRQLQQPRLAKIN